MFKKPVIVFEGIEGSGKSFHINNVAKYLKKKNIGFIKLREPGGSKNSERIRNLILDVLFKAGIKDPRDLEMHINNIPGVLENGLFVDLTDKVLVGRIENNVPVLFSPSKRS